MSTRSTCALPLLCLVQSCERFAFFAVLPWFVLYLHRHVGVTEHAALVLLGVFLALSYLASLAGGVIADRWLGSALGTLLGSMLLGLGYGALVIDYRPLLWPALALQVAGHGLFKPSISVATSALYPADDVRRERGFLIMHVAVNVGAMMGPLCAEWSRGPGWSGMFRWAAGSMAAAVATLLLGYPWISQESHRQSAAPLPDIDDSAHERLRAIRLLCVAGAVLWLTAQQAGTSLALFAESHTRLYVSLLHFRVRLGPGHFASLHSLLVLLIMPVMLLGFSWLRRREREPSAFAKMVWGYIFTAAAFVVMGAAGLRDDNAGRVSPAWLTGCYSLLSIAELLLAPMGLSLITQLAPQKQISRMVGWWFATTAIGNVLAGALGLLWGRWSNHSYFALLALVSLSAGLALASRLSQLERLLKPPRV